MAAHCCMRNVKESGLSPFRRNCTKELFRYYRNSKCHHRAEDHRKVCKLSVTESKQFWKPVIGLEIHAQIQAETKLFSRSLTQYGAPVNTQVQLLDMALPGTLPVINRRCVEAGVLTALALNCRINEVSRFDRKHYFYSDLPAGYQITQQKHALANDGIFQYIIYGRTHNDCVEKTVRITQLQLEQDSGKSLHDDVENKSLIDLNRAGCALMEIVTAPDLYSAEEARSFIRDLRQTLILIQTCDGKMEEGSLRVDANISVHREGEPLGVRTEVKNINSLHGVKKAINFEIKRQIEVLEKGGEVVNETRSYDASAGQTVPMRDKEVKQDYRFMPEPNLTPLHVYQTVPAILDDNSTTVVIEELQNQLPKLPSELRKYLMSEFDCSLFQAGFIVNEGVADYFINLARDWNSTRFRNFFIYHFVNNLIQFGVEPESCEIPPTTLSTLYSLFLEEDIGNFSMTEVIKLLLKNPSADPKQLIDKENLWMIKDETTLRTICKQILESPSAKKAIKKYKKGNTKDGIGSLVHLANKATNKRGHTYKMSLIFKELLDKELLDKNKECS